MLTMSAVNTDPNPSEIGTRAMGRERLRRMRAMLGVCNELAGTFRLGNWHDVSLVEADKTWSCKSTIC